MYISEAYIEEQLTDRQKKILKTAGKIALATGITIATAVTIAKAHENAKTPEEKEKARKMTEQLSKTLQRKAKASRKKKKPVKEDFNFEFPEKGEDSSVYTGKGQPEPPTIHTATDLLKQITISPRLSNLGIQKDKAQLLKNSDWKGRLEPQGGEGEDPPDGSYHFV